MQTSAHPYAELTPDRILDALSTIGIDGDGRLLTLNSYENRVYQVGLHDGGFVVAKFYRPERWSDEQIQEEHDWLDELCEEEIPVVPAMRVNGATLHHAEGFRLAVFERRGGRAPELDNPEILRWLGRFLARIHRVGARSRFASRPAISPQTYGLEPRAWLAQSGMVPAALMPAWSSVMDQALEAIQAAFLRHVDVRMLRAHGDCHVGNILWTESGPHFVDFDDARSAPAVQDLWMMLSGSHPEVLLQLQALVGGYEEFREFDRAELGLIEPLRTLRLIHYSAWIARRWDDPAFPAAFPWFATERYWQDRILELREQIGLMSEDQDWRF